MLLEEMAEAVETFFLTMNLERGEFDTFEISGDDIEKTLNLKRKNIFKSNDKSDGVLYFNSDRVLKLRIYKSLVLSSEYNEALICCSSKNLYLNFYKFVFKVETQQEVIRSLMIFDNYYKELLKEIS